MFQKGVSQSTRKNLAILAQIPDIKDFYLAGGTACALHFGHRLSFDLDFFTQKVFNGKKLAEKIGEHSFLTIEQVLEDTLLGKMNDEKVSFFYYRYPILKPSHSWKGISIASVKDLAAMKIEAISGRGKRRDFIDLYVLCKNISLEDFLQAYEQKYKVLANNLIHILKSLEYFDDAEHDEIPQMIQKISWDEVKAFFEKEVKRLSKKFLEP